MKIDARDDDVRRMSFIKRKIMYERGKTFKILFANCATTVRKIDGDIER